MLVPDFLFGTASDVRSNVAKVVTRLRHGTTLALIARLRNDDDLWNDLVRRWRSEAGVPDLTLENFVEIRRLCEAGSWDEAQWAFLKTHGGSEAVHRALERVEASGDWRTFLGVLIHALDDMERAAELFTKLEGTTPEIEWARDRVEQYREVRHPERSAAVSFEAAARARSLRRRR